MRLQVVCDLDGNVRHTVGGFVHPRSVTVLPDGRFGVASWGHWDNSTGRMDPPTVALIVDPDAPLSDVPPVVLMGLSQLGAGAGQFNHPSGLAAGPLDGELTVADMYNNRLQVFSTVTGAWLRSLGAGRVGDALGQLNWPAGLVYDAGAGELFVAEHDGHRLHVFR